MNFNFKIFIDIQGKYKIILDKTERGARERERAILVLLVGVVHFSILKAPLHGGYKQIEQVLEG